MRGSPDRTMVIMAMSLWAVSAQAAQLVPGSYGAVGPDPSVFASEGATGWTEPFVVEFTPRSSGSFLIAGPTAASSWSDVPVDLARPLATLENLGFLGRDDDSGFIIGGALRIDTMALSVGLGQPTILGTPSQLFAAGMTVGRLSASIGYATAAGADTDPLDMLMLRTDVAALPWLSLESEMAVGDTVETGTLAVGRIGVRLNF